MLLLVVSYLVLFLFPFSLLSQTDGINLASDSATRFSTGIGTVPSGETYTGFTRSPTASAGPVGFSLIARTAGKIFSGRVIAIDHRPADREPSVETISITFRVEKAIRGASPRQRLTIRQWMGLWSAGQRYRVGERALLFLYPRSKLGLTSCVAGPLGRFAIDPSGQILLSAQQLSAFRTDSVLAGKSRVRISDFALAVQRASEEE